MKEKSGIEFMVGHLPNREDIIDVHDVFQVLFLWSLDQLEYWDEDEVVPKWAKYVIDPKPNVDISYDNIHLLRQARVHVLIASYIDAFHIFHVASPLSHFDIGISVLDRLVNEKNRTLIWFRVMGGLDGPNVFTPHTPIIVWSVMGASRPSFLRHFQMMVNLHQPHVIVLLEARVSDYQFDAIHTDLDTTLSYKCVRGAGLRSGIVLMWCETKVRANITVSIPGGKARLHATIRVKFFVLPY